MTDGALGPWQDFNDAAPQDDCAGLEADAGEIAIFLDVVFGYCDGWVPLRGFVDKGQGLQGRPHNAWIQADATMVDSALAFAGWAAREGAAFYVVPGTVAESGQAKSADIRQMQAVVVDLDTGDIEAKLAHLVRYLGDPTLVVESGGRTPEGDDKLHVWWRLTEPAEGEDIDLLCRLRGDIADKVGGDTHFHSAHQPIRVAGSVYHKGGRRRLVQIRTHVPGLEVDLRDFAERVDAMPLLPGIGMAPRPAAAARPGIDAILLTPVHEGGADDWTRFQGASAAIGHYVRMAHEGRISRDEAWEAICQYNAAQLRPSWELERLAAEAQRLWRLHEEKHGPGLDPPGIAAHVRLAGLLVGAVARRRQPHARRHHRAPPGDAGRHAGAGWCAQGGQERFPHQPAGPHGGGGALPRLHSGPAAALFYLQAEIQYHYLRERLRSIRLDPTILAAARDNLVATPKVRMLLDGNGLAQTIAAVRSRFGDAPPDIICIYPIRNLFDGGPDGSGENDNAAMLFFLQERVEALRDAVAPDAGLILCHHTRKITKKLLAEDPFMALSGAGALRSFYTSGIIMFRPDEERPERLLHFELRNGPAIEPRIIDKVHGRWVEIDRASERLVRKAHGDRLDAERVRKHDVILQILLDEAAQGRLYTTLQFAETFENQGGLGGKDTIRDRVSVLATKGYIKFVRDGGMSRSMLKLEGRRCSP